MHEAQKYPEENSEDALDPADGEGFEYVRRNSDPLQNVST